jgi:endonuclease/exonuclease/phosphatase (EEP) superfamily protein YafD
VRTLSRRPKIARVVVVALAVAAIAVSAIALAIRYPPVEGHVVVAVAALSGYLVVGAPLGLVLSVLCRQRVLTVAAVAMTIATVVVESPLFLAEKPTFPATSMRVMTANLYLGQADPQKIVATAAANADVLALQELTPEAVAGLTSAGLDRHFPFRLLDARGYASGVGLWSRYPLTQSTRVSGFTLAMVRARIHVDAIPVDPTIVVAHMSGPWPQPIDDWQRDMSLMPATLQAASVASGAGCVFAAGDFNATYDMRTFRDLLRDGYRDAAEQAGSGITATYPANTWVPPMLAIDHLITRQCEATSVKVVDVPGSDHRGLIATLAIPTQR